MSKQIIMYMHGGSGNHGCEAIVNSTCRMLEYGAGKNRQNQQGQHEESVQAGDGRKVILATNSEAEDQKYTLGELCEIRQEKRIAEHFLMHVLLYGWRKLTGDRESFMRYRFQNIRKQKKPSLYISIGGDNYCYPELVDELVQTNQMLHKEGADTILWGCSIEPGMLTGAEVLADMKRYNLIIARESLTVAALREAGIIENVRQYPDPAFSLRTRIPEYPKGFEVGNMVGINISPMIIRKEQQPGITVQNYRKLIMHILETSAYGVALIPHVIWTNDDDRRPLREIYDACIAEHPEYTDRIVMIEDHDCETQKGYIGACRMFLGARTHSTIAAYSSCVPTVVIGYSIKARGIARDLFGTDEHYVKPVQSISGENELVEAYDWLQEHYDEIKAQLEKVMPEYVQRAFDAGKEIWTWAEK